MSDQQLQRSACGKPIKSTLEDSLATLVKDYWNKCQYTYDQEDQWWTEPDTWQGVLERAWLSKMRNGKMHGHQCNNGTQRLAEGLKIASSANKSPDDFPDFDALYRWIESITGQVAYLGTLATYDVARRIGANYGLKPQNVYLHRGSKEGAKKLGIKKSPVPIDDFPDEIRSSPLDATHIENFLCIYKAKLGCSQ